MPKRSPILGYNHNVRHRGVVFHVQTEDSGVDNPHLFTHLFSGGTIISTRKLDYDPGAAEDSVKHLMQSQHKAMLKELKAGAFDEKIDRYLVGHPDLQPLAGAAAAAAATASVELTATARDGGATDTSATQRTPIAALGLVAEDTSPSGIVTMVGEEDSDSTIRIAVADGEPERPRRDTAPDVPVVRPPAAAVVVPPPRPPGTARPAAPVNLAAAAAAAANEPAAAALKPPPIRPSPGSVEFRPAAGEPARARVVEPGAPRIDTRKPHGATESEVSAAFKAISSDDAVAAAARQAAERAAAAARDLEAQGSQYFHSRTGRHSASPEAIEDDPTNRHDPIPPVRGGKRPAATPPPIKPASKARPAVVVSRPSVIVGAPPKIVGAPPRQSGSGGHPRVTEGKAPRRTRDSRGGLFGKDLISEKSLDEVILAYLSEDGEER